MPDISDLRQRQALPLRAKVLMSQNRIREWYDHWNGDVYISFSGGKDSTVLAHLVHDLYPDVPMVFSNTGLEYPEKLQFPILHRYPWLMPVMQVCRWCKRLLGGYGRKAALELTHSHRISEKSEENIRDMLENIGL